VGVRGREDSVITWSLLRKIESLPIIFSENLKLCVYLERGKKEKVLFIAYKNVVSWLYPHGNMPNLGYKCCQTLPG
jgi:hypothetical protein